MSQWSRVAQRISGSLDHPRANRRDPKEKSNLVYLCLPATFFLARMKTHVGEQGSDGPRGRSSTEPIVLIGAVFESATKSVMATAEPPDAW